MQDKISGYFNGIKGKTIALIGIGISNLPLIKLFKKHGAEVIACDSKSETELGENAQKAKEYGAKLRLGKDYLKGLECDVVFRTPGMRYYSDELNEIRRRGIEISSEMELFFELCPCKIIAVTGSDGKTTTTSIIAEFLKAEGFTVHLGGNIGMPLLQKIEDIMPEDYAVVELSSFQLISMKSSPDIAVVTNLSPNHLDMHKDMQEYIDAKKNIFLHQGVSDKVVINADNEITASFSDEAKGEKSYFSRKKAVTDGAYLDQAKIVHINNGEITEVIDISEIKIPGMHNVENYLAAISAIWGLVSVENIKKVAAEFSGVEHRAEFVREVDGVRYYNDSIASSPTRTASGTLSLYDEKIILISGGYDKNISYDELGPIICKKAKSLVLMGNTARKIEKAVKNSSEYSENNPKIYRVENMTAAVKKAREIAIQGDIVSMSPASASFDLYKNFDERGKHFKELVNKL